MTILFIEDARSARERWDGRIGRYRPLLKLAEVESRLRDENVLPLRPRETANCPYCDFPIPFRAVHYCWEVNRRIERIGSELSVEPVPWRPTFWL